MTEDGSRELSPLVVIHLCRSVRSLPDGSRMPAHLAHALLVLATYWPKIFPSQVRLADDMSVSRRHVNRRLRQLEEHGFIWRRRSQGSTVYRLNIALIRKCGAIGVTSRPLEEQTNSTAGNADAEWFF